MPDSFPSLPPAPKTCTRCHEVKPADAFSPRSRACRICNYAQVKAWRRKYPERHRAGRKASYLKNPEKVRAQNKAYRRKHVEQIRAMDKAYRRRNPEKNRATVKAWRLQNPEKARATKQAYRLQNAEKISATNRAYRLQNAEQDRATKEAYRLKNLEQFRATGARRRARKRQATVNDLTAQDWRDILAAFKHCCAYCGRTMQRLTQDHITPLIAGGNHTKSNVVPACKSCNSKKHIGPPPVPVQPLLL